LPFILLGIGVDDAFVIVNAFNRERKVPRTSEDNETLAVRSGRGLARAGASITVTSLTDLVAFAISTSSALPALASFCAYAAISIFFLWLFAATFFTATLVLDERRQRDNRRECLCCVTRKSEIKEDKAFQEDLVSRYFRNYHAPAILSNVGKAIVLAMFAALLGFGIYGTINLTVEDTEREFIPDDSYLKSYFEAADRYFPSKGIDVYFVFEGSEMMYENRQSLADLGEDRLTGLSENPPYLAEPVSEEAYRNVMTGLHQYLEQNGSGAIGGVELGDDNWPTNEADFVLTLQRYASFVGPGAIYSQDLSYSGNGTELAAYRVQCEYVRLTKVKDGKVIDDADRQIEAMDATRELLQSWTDLQPTFPYSEKFITIEGFKIIQRELLQNVGLAILAVGVIVFFTVASPVTALLVTFNVAACLVEILGFMSAAGIVIDSVSVINLVLAVGLSVDYSAHVGHCFMVKGGDDKNRRAVESLADIGAAVLSGAFTTFLAVVVLLFSSSYVFEVLSRQFALTVALGVAHGLLLLPVLLSLLGPKPFASAEDPEDDTYDAGEPPKKTVEHSETVAMEGIGATGHGSANGNSSGDENEGVGIANDEDANYEA
jgi:predicted RND superfamily exporter protein